MKTLIFLIIISIAALEASEPVKNIKNGNAVNKVWGIGVGQKLENGWFEVKSGNGDFSIQLPHQGVVSTLESDDKNGKKISIDTIGVKFPDGIEFIIMKFDNSNGNTIDDFNKSRKAGVRIVTTEKQKYLGFPSLYAHYEPAVISNFKISSIQKWVITDVDVFWLMVEFSKEKEEMCKKLADTFFNSLKIPEKSELTSSTISANIAIIRKEDKKSNAPSWLTFLDISEKIKIDNVVNFQNGITVGVFLLIFVITCYVRKKLRKRKDELNDYDEAFDGYYAKIKLGKIIRGLKILNWIGIIGIIYFGYWYIIDGYLEVGNLFIFILIYIVFLFEKIKIKKQLENINVSNEKI